MTRGAQATKGGEPLPSALHPWAASPLSEADLVAIWEGQRFPAAALVTGRGERLRVVYRGRRQGGPGPDFRDATIVAPAGLQHGDVELHLRASDFGRHGHHLDAAYQGLILHVVFWDDEGEDTALANGRRVPVIALAPWLARRANEIQRWLQGPPLWQEPCRTALARLGGREVALALERLGDMRFRQRVAAIAKELDQEEAQEVLYRRLLEALGYGGNRQPFLALAHACPWSKLQAALLARRPGERQRQAEALLLEAAAAFPWRTQGLRPANRPPRRLAGAAALAARFARTGLLHGLMAAVGEGAQLGPSALLRALIVDEGGVALIGSSRAGEMAVNVALPFAVAWGSPALQAAAEALYRRWPRPSPYGITRHLDQALSVGEEEGIAVNARRQQGMLYLYKAYCSRGGCGRCPLS